MRTSIFTAFPTLLRWSAGAIAGIVAFEALHAGEAPQPARFPADLSPVQTYTLPEPLRTVAGRSVANAAEWRGVRRPEVLELFRQHVYGRVPATPFTQTSRVVAEKREALGGVATRKDVDITIAARGKSLVIHLVLFVPNAAKGPVPAFLLLANRSVPEIDPTLQPNQGYWPLPEAMARGYAMAAFHTWDVDPDKNEGFHDGIHAMLDTGPRAPDAWGTIAAWAWGASRCLDYLVTDPAIAAERVAVVGHSRAGKTALWAAAQDERFAIACSNDSGCGGAALSRRRTKEKETVAAINRLFPHWFAETFKAYANREDALPVDQHLLIALIAPRTVCVASGSEDLWADPRGEFLSVVHARPVFALFGLDALGAATDMPAIGEPLHGDGAHYWIRAGKHALTLSDWMFYFGSADRAYARAPRTAAAR